MGRMSDTDAPSSSAAHLTWWRAPLVASAPGLPLIVLDHFWFASHGGPGPFGGVLHWAIGLLVLAWVLPHRRSLRGLRIAAAGAGLACALFPPGFALLLGLAWSAST
ncbi:putative membrane protein [Streptomyces glaucescens]|uniref:Putative membrane protein n=2 Tax=Streptomyces glaucescens TaxID=1907 RepID=A0A089XC40_STRGA|nr:putative membrane protein [Streptomyces glaucescens]